MIQLVNRPPHLRVNLERFGGDGRRGVEGRDGMANVHDTKREVIEVIVNG